MKDVISAARLMDALPELDFVMSLFLPKDVNQKIYDRYQMEVMLNNTIKPIVYVTPDFEGCKAAVEMCEAVAGDVAEFRRKPFAACYINVTSGLVANQESLLHGANIVHDVGFMDSGLQGSLQLLVMANEFIGFLRAATRGVPVDGKRLALDMVAELGPTGDYLQHPHTMSHVREPFYSDLMHKGVFAQWEKQAGIR